ncbi:hypothetical protein ACVXG8_06745 [Escherichia coli]
MSNLDIEGKVEDIVLQLSPMNKVTAKSFTIDSGAIRRKEISGW